MWRISREGKEVPAAVPLGVYFLFKVLSCSATLGPCTQTRGLLPLHTAFQAQACHLGLGHVESGALGWRWSMQKVSSGSRSAEEEE